MYRIFHFLPSLGKAGAFSLLRYLLLSNFFNDNEFSLHFVFENGYRYLFLWNNEFFVPGTYFAKICYLMPTTE